MKPSIKILVEGGKATAGPPIGPALGPLGINVGKVVAEINEKTASFKGMKVSVEVIIDKKTREFKIEVGSPPASALILKELGLEKGSKAAGREIAGNLSLEQVLKLAKVKEKTMFAKNVKNAVKELMGTCLSMGIQVENRDPRELMKEIDEGKWDKLIR